MYCHTKGFKRLQEHSCLLGLCCFPCQDAFTLAGIFECRLCSHHYRPGASQKGRFFPRKHWVANSELEREAQSIGAPGARLGLFLRPQSWDDFNWVLDCMGRIWTKSASCAATHPALGLPHFQTSDAHTFWSSKSWSPRHTSTDDWRNSGWDWQHTLQTKVSDRHILISRWYHFVCVDCSNASRTLGVGTKKPVRQWPLCIVWWCPRKDAGRVAKNAGWVRAGSEQATLWKTCHEALRRIALEATMN